nr:MAG: polyprotein [Picornaviridae sp.]
MKPSSFYSFLFTYHDTQSHHLRLFGCCLCNITSSNRTMEGFDNDARVTAAVAKFSGLTNDELTRAIRGQQLVWRHYHKNTIGHVGYYRPPPTLPRSDEIDGQLEFHLRINVGVASVGIRYTTETSWNDLINRCQGLLPKKWRNRRWEHQGNSVTNIYGNNNNVSTEQGANGWTPTLPINVAEGPITSSNSMEQRGKPGGSSTTKPPPSAATERPPAPPPRRKWWEGAAEKVVGSLGDAAARGINAGVDAGVRKLRGKAPTTVGEGAEMSTVSRGNAAVQSQHAVGYSMEYPATPCVPLPTSDDPSGPGPSGDRIWLVDTFSWNATHAGGTFISGANAWIWPPWTAKWPATTKDGNGCYPYPFIMPSALPNNTWTAMYNNHAFWNSGVRATLTVNGSQFHAGALVIVGFPEWTREGPPESVSSLFVQPYQILNLATTNRVTLDLPYIGVNPLDVAYCHCPWLIGIFVLTPLVVPTDAAQELSVSVYMEPVNSTFHGLRFDQGFPQHWKVRQVPGALSFGNAIAGQEMPLCGVLTTAPPRDYLPGEVTDWVEFAHRPGLMDAVTWTMADDIGQMIATYPLNPAVLAGTSTPLAFVMNLFSQWRGELNLHLLFTGSAQHYGRLVVAFTPYSGEPPATMELAMHGTYTVWDINGMSTLDFTIPYISSTYWRVMDAADTTSYMAQMGYVSVWVQNPLTGPSSAPPSAIIQGFVSAADTFDVRLLQNPTYSFQGDPDQASQDLTGHEVMEDGSVDNRVQERPGIGPALSMRPPDSTISVFASIYRQIPVDGTYGPVTVSTAGQLLDLSAAALSATTSAQPLTPWYLSVFSYIVADMRLNLRIENVSADYILVSYVPPGGTTPVDLVDVVAWNYYTVSCPLDAGTQSFAFSIPYSAPLSALAPGYCGYNGVAGQPFGEMAGNTWGTVIVLPIGGEVIMHAECAFTNFHGFVPKATWALSKPTQVRSISTIRAVEYKPAGPSSSLYYYQGDAYDDEWEMATYWIVRDGIHWAVRAEYGDHQEQISLVRHGMRAVVDYEEPIGEHVEEIGPSSYYVARSLVGTEQKYNILSNCTHFVERVTGRKCYNYGTGMLAGMAVATAATALVQAQPERNFKPQCVGGLLKIASDPKRFDTMLKVIDSSMTRLEKVASRDNVQDIKDAAGHLEAAARSMTTCMADLKVLSSTVMSVGMAESHPFLTTLCSVVVKIIGYCLIIFGSPHPLTVVGLAMVLGADVAAGPINGILAWLKKKLGVAPPSDVVQAIVDMGNEPEPSTSQASAPTMTPQGVQDYNHAVTALKNFDWVLAKIFNVVLVLLNWLKKESTESDEAFVHSQYETILELYEDSIAVLSNPGNVDMKIMQRNAERAREILKRSSQTKLTYHTATLSKAVSNYATASSRDSRAPRSRPEPYVVVLSGPPGAGKSVIATLVARAVAKALTGDAMDVYSPTSIDCKYYDGYHGQAVHLIDDMGQDPAGEDYRDFVNLVSTAPFVVPMAQIEEKGTHYTSRCIIITTNFDTPNERAVRSLGALQRRLHTVFSVKGAVDMSTAMDPTGPRTKHFAHACDLVEMRSYSLRCRKDCVVAYDVAHLDQLVDKIVGEVNRRAQTSDTLMALIPQVESSIKSPWIEEIERNLPPAALTWIKEYKKPIIYTGLVITSISALFTCFYLAKQFMADKPMNKATDQGAYSGIKKQQQTAQKTAPPQKYVKPKLPMEYQGYPMCLPKIFGNVYPILGEVNGIQVSSMSGMYLTENLFVFPSHFLNSSLGELDTIIIGSKRVKLDEVEVFKHQELAWLRVPGRHHTSLIRFIRETPHKTGFLLGHTRGTPVIVRATNIERKSLHNDLLDNDDTFQYTASTFVGLCGAPLVVDDPAGPAVVGIHFAGVANIAGASASLLDLIPRMMEAQSVIVDGPHLEHPVYLNRKTKLRPSPAYGAFAITKEPAVLSDWDPRAEKVCALTKHGKGDITEPWPGLEEAFELYFNQFPSKFRVLSQDEAINGIYNLEGIDMKQSPGLPWVQMSRSRRSLFELEGERWRPVPELQAAIDKLWVDYDYTYVSQLKDELRPLTKVTSGLTRVVEAAPIQAIVVGRMLFGSLFAYMHTNVLDHGSAVGCDPDIAWTLIYHRCAGWYVYDIDYKGFDASVPSVCFDLLAKHLTRIIGDSRVKDYMETIKKSKHVFGQRTYEMVGGMPSGCVGTSIFNTIINNCAIISWLIQENIEDWYILAYGDDVLLASPVPLDINKLKKFYEKHTNFVITPASKDGEFPEKSGIEDVSFLKRRFVPDPNRPYFIHPMMDPETLTNSVMWQRDGDWHDTVTALAQLAFHSGPSNFEAWKEAIERKAAERGVRVSVPPWKYLYYKWLLVVEGK